MSTLKAEHVQLQFPKQSLPVLQDVNLSIESGSLNVILGNLAAVKPHCSIFWRASKK